ncbi:formyltetrahydrofolate deformylase [Pseudohaliea sp.]|uniref:formyltetrahydrofolate deformylase n=1 Tax=Pseudohaliea sp. TaxID=2740289 RepID=UPI0032EFABD4
MNKNQTPDRLILRLSCDDRPGVVAAVTTFFAERGWSIVESAQHTEPSGNQFFLRSVLCPPAASKDTLETLQAAFATVAEEFSMDWSLRKESDWPRTVIAVSKWGHCLNALLNAWKSGELPLAIVAIVSNHRDMEGLAEWYEVPYHHLPVTPETKAEQEVGILKVMEDRDAELLLLARYMQILSDSLCEKLEGRAINIHHSFLPGFKGAKPYHQAYDKGVKLIGATAHYVTADLDEGPIIEQDVVRVSHAAAATELVTVGKNVEAQVLARAAKWHAEGRVMLASNNRTVVFDR